jgi:class 3 adenylate cyclase
MSAGVLVRQLLHRYQGRAVKTLGDGFPATFDGPERAVQCANELTQEVARVGVTIRAGIHTGEIEVMGDDIAGLAVHLASRVAAVAGPGEVLVTSTVRELVMGSTLRFSDLGRRALKGVPGEWQLLMVESRRGTAEARELLPTTMRGSTFTGRTMDAMATRTPRLARTGARLSRRMAAARAPKR